MPPWWARTLKAIWPCSSSKGAKGLRPLAVGNSTNMRLGDTVLAVGNPFGLEQTVTMGIVSAKGRANLRIVDYEDFIQTDAAINPGNSGGALVNIRGELIGINTAILSRTGGYQGIGFAIPTGMALPIIRSLLKSGKVIRGYLGIMIQDVDADMAKALKLPSSSGVLVSDVIPDSPAAKAGLKRGDFILKIAGRSVDSASRLRNIVASHGARRQVALDLVRKGKKKNYFGAFGRASQRAEPHRIGQGQFRVDPGLADARQATPPGPARSDPQWGRRRAGGSGKSCRRGRTSSWGRDLGGESS